jgi:hypothetical protein
MFFQILLENLLDALEEAHHTGAQQAIDCSLAFLAVIDNACLSEYAQVFPNGGLIAPDYFHEVTGADFASFVQSVNDLESAGVRQRLEYLGAHFIYFSAHINLPFIV